ncbi:MAG: hypothetical protein AB8A36_06315, partial [Prochlorococcus sp.]
NFKYRNIYMARKKNIKKETSNSNVTSSNQDEASLDISEVEVKKLISKGIVFCSDPLRRSSSWRSRLSQID